ncbi:hypothetical protein FHR81_002299 [Actinoalloteichus hoggarensis]|uniref:hypothetical protein n=1 Tax=Actinoalloteichus hoggarensis TaxID=1470176 RepID=UPI0012FE044E|nr:hypothetical protein [Actinoalloteichus hoggarensis]MBB5921261.1 hypothetical protein [Actinoalloteichus hoggarensis]
MTASAGLEPLIVVGMVVTSGATGGGPRARCEGGGDETDEFTPCRVRVPDVPPGMRGSRTGRSGLAAWAGGQEMIGQDTAGQGTVHGRRTIGIAVGGGATGRLRANGVPPRGVPAARARGTRVVSRLRPDPRTRRAVRTPETAQDGGLAPADSTGVARLARHRRPVVGDGEGGRSTASRVVVRPAVPKAGAVSGSPRPAPDAESGISRPSLGSSDRGRRLDTPVRTDEAAPPIPSPPTASHGEVAHLAVLPARRPFRSGALGVVRSVRSDSIPIAGAAAVREAAREGAQQQMQAGEVT